MCWKHILLKLEIGKAKPQQTNKQKKFNVIFQNSLIVIFSSSSSQSKKKNEHQQLE